jgi:hypothetical protein
VQERTTAAIICYYHPAVATTSELREKKDWAEFFGVTKQRFGFWEEKLAESIGPFQRGAVPVPAPPEGKTIPLISEETEDVVITELHGINLADLKADLASRCTRPLDAVTYTARGAFIVRRTNGAWGRLLTTS